MADLTADTFVWRELPTPPFERRALATAAFDGKLYVIGGMQNRGGPTGAVDVFDPATQTWSTGPALDGAAACAVGGSLYVSTVQGHLQRMDLGANSWSTVQQLPTSRFFHRMLPVGDDRLMIVGGANMDTGRFRQVDVFEVAPA
ncbi:Kelch repeat-containing protein [Symmachiella dynata]|uniref:Kelch repeat-containing protein n=1 Tax=Symmachiella dynata TaxID=2527995 RepID=UPI0030EF6F94